MNVKKMSTENLQEEIERIKSIPENDRMVYQVQFLNSCSKELARRWGIKL